MHTVCVILAVIHHVDQQGILLRKAAVIDADLALDVRIHKFFLAADADAGIGIVGHGGNGAAFLRLLRRYIDRILIYLGIERRIELPAGYGNGAQRCVPHRRRRLHHRIILGRIGIYPGIRALAGIRVNAGIRIHARIRVHTGIRINTGIRVHTRVGVYTRVRILTGAGVFAGVDRVARGSIPRSGH